VDRASLTGVALVTVAILGGFVMEGGRLESIIQPTAGLIVFGGTIGALFLQFTMEHILLATRDLRTVFVHVEQTPLRKLMDLMLVLAKKAHRDGLHQLEDEIENIDEPFLNKALLIAVDGSSADSLRHSLELEMDAIAEQSDLGARVFEAGGGYAPTIGILGAVLGLIHVMEKLTEPEKLGGGIAVAFVATIYGVGLANLILLPIAGKIRVRNQAIWQRHELIVEAIVGIAQGEHPATIGDRLEGLIDQEQKPETSNKPKEPPTTKQAGATTNTTQTKQATGTATPTGKESKSTPTDKPADTPQAGASKDT